VVVAINEIDDEKKKGELLAILITMGVQCAVAQCGVHCPMNHSCALLEATGCRHQVGACITLPQRLPWVDDSGGKHKTLTKNYF